MKIKLPLTLVIAVFLTACEIPGAVISTPVLPSSAQPADSSGCISMEPTQDDVDRTLTYTDNIFSGADWVRSYTVKSGHVYASWSNESLAALSFTEALIFSCGYAESDLDSYYSDTNWQIIFANYESYKPVSECKSKDGLRLYQFTAVKEGYEYAIKYWVLKDTVTRVMEMMIVFPIESKSEMDDTSSKLFPDLTSCK
ncbi:MAG: hypothetical protein HZB50_00590 [Chloroflexi bacterium]|nr:hypothetical protein [Chloroflexota bacterium]